MKASISSWIPRAPRRKFSAFPILIVLAVVGTFGKSIRLGQELQILLEWLTRLAKGQRPRSGCRVHPRDTSDPLIEALRTCYTECPNGTGPNPPHE